MSIIAKPLATFARNKGEYDYKLGVSVVDENGAAVTVTGDVKVLYLDTDGALQQLVGTSSENNAYYDVTVNDFTESAIYKYWVQCFTVDIYGPFELKIQDIA